MSKEKIEDILKKLMKANKNIFFYEKNYAFQDKGFKLYKYDFAIFSLKNNDISKPLLLIEYDKKDHFNDSFYLSMNGSSIEHSHNHIIKNQLSDAYKDYIANCKNTPILRVNDLQLPILQEAIYSYIYVFVLNKNHTGNREEWLTQIKYLLNKKD